MQSIPTRTSCLGCCHRRAITASIPHETVCHYLLDTGKPRSCPPTQCQQWQPSPSCTTLLGRIMEGGEVNEQLQVAVQPLQAAL